MTPSDTQSPIDDEYFHYLVLVGYLTSFASPLTAFPKDLDCLSLNELCCSTLQRLEIRHGNATTHCVLHAELKNLYDSGLELRHCPDTAFLNTVDTVETSLNTFQNSEEMNKNKFFLDFRFPQAVGAFVCGYVYGELLYTCPTHCTLENLPSVLYYAVQEALAA